MMVIGSRVVVLGINPDRKGRDAFGITQRMPASMEAFFSSEVTVATACGLAVLFALVFLALVVLASFGVIDGKFLLELIRAFRK
ncbi:hypothetical protein [Mitsuokella jalaludinii]|uniref:hypothetical protein n=1 Tax=Mitsuokella jalaludinii TaxID=187979 RepID=UPI00298C01DA|nr:hypothetical protein [Mitsuokella jalaludinii]